MKLNKELTEQWIVALRSGEYKQGRSRLCREDDSGQKLFCCMGVLCDVVAPGIWRKDLRSDTTTYTHLASFTYPHGKIADRVGLSDSQQLYLAKMNDEQNADFNEIADLIQSWLDRDLRDVS